jgi:hypothetical protein
MRTQKKATRLHLSPPSPCVNVQGASDAVAAQRSRRQQRQQRRPRQREEQHDEAVQQQRENENHAQPRHALLRVRREQRGAPPQSLRRRASVRAPVYSFIVIAIVVVV